MHDDRKNKKNLKRFPCFNLLKKSNNRSIDEYGGKSVQFESDKNPGSKNTLPLNSTGTQTPSLTAKLCSICKGNREKSAAAPVLSGNTIVPVIELTNESLMDSNNDEQI